MATRAKTKKKKKKKKAEKSKKEEQNRTQFGPPADIDCYYVLLLLSKHMMKIADKQPKRAREWEKAQESATANPFSARIAVRVYFVRVHCDIGANRISIGLQWMHFDLVSFVPVSGFHVAAALFTLHLTVKANSFRENCWPIHLDWAHIARMRRGNRRKN